MTQVRPPFSGTRVSVLTLLSLGNLLSSLQLLHWTSSRLAGPLVRANAVLADPVLRHPWLPLFAAVRRNSADPRGGHRISVRFTRETKQGQPKSPYKKNIPLRWSASSFRSIPVLTYVFQWGLSRLSSGAYHRMKHIYALSAHFATGSMQAESHRATSSET